MLKLLRFDLIRCVFGFHAWHTYCRSKNAERHTKRDCCRCGFTQERLSPWSRWQNEHILEYDVARSRSRRRRFCPVGSPTLSDDCHDLRRHLRP